jgi:hypothetical protein
MEIGREQLRKKQKGIAEMQKLLRLLQYARPQHHQFNGLQGLQEVYQRVGKQE